MRTLITGIDGFVGRYLAAELRDHGYDVYGTTIGPSTDRVVHIDLTDPVSTASVISEIRPDFLFHLAGFTSVKESWDQPDAAMRVNRDGTRHLFQALQHQQLKPRVVLTSTAEVYGLPSHMPIVETDPVAPTNPYAQSKLAQEQVAKEFPDIPTTIARSFPHIGSGQALKFVAADFARQIVAIEHDQLDSISVGNLHAIRDYTDVRDVVRAYRLLAELGDAGEAYNVCSGHGYRIGEILDHLLLLSTKKNISVVLDQTKLRPSDIPCLVGSNTKIRSKVGWVPVLDVRNTLAEILNMYRHEV